MSKGKKKQAKKSALKDLPGRTVRASEQNKVKGGMMMMDVTTEEPSSGGGGTSSVATKLDSTFSKVGKGFTSGVNSIGTAIRGIFT